MSVWCRAALTAVAVVAAGVAAAPPGSAAAGVAPAAPAATAAPAAVDAMPDPGEAIYLRGTLRSGEALVATRADAPPVTGPAAACVSCHRRSGLGTQEGRTQIPPIAGRFLFESHAGSAEQADLPYVPGMRAGRPPYDDATLARAIREGIGADGQPLSYLMPRFALGDADMAAVIDHLKRLGPPRQPPGVYGGALHLATIVTPDADPDKRRGMLDVLDHFIADRNGAQRRAPAELQTSGKTTYAKMMLRLSQRWQLHVWELQGPPATWEAQLERLFAAQPVFAVLSGLGGRTWAPVQTFCERARLPCLFPNVEAPPPDADEHFYTMYLSRGVLLEADLVGADLARRPPDAAVVVRQVFRAGDVGEAAAAELAARLSERGVRVEDRIVHEKSPGGVAAAIGTPGEHEVLVLWLRPDDLRALPGTPRATVYASAIMGGYERAPLPAAWRSRVVLAYPVDLPERRLVRVDFALGWFRIRRIPVVAEPVQADTYLVCGLLSETMRHLIDATFRDYLVERLEDGLEHRLITGYYPRLALAPGQRFASKGGYLVRFAADRGTKLVTDGGWVVP